MRRSAILRKVLQAILLVGASLVILFCITYRPWELHYGATREEIGRQMPGDDIVENPTFNATRSITIKAAPEDIWPWIIQIGYGRAGFYSHDWLDNAGVSSSKEIIPEYQTLQPGELIPLTEQSTIRVESLEPNRSLVLVYGSEANPVFTWVWGLYPSDRERTRMVVRLRWHQDRAREKIMTRLFEIIMMKKHLKGIRKRAVRF
ncbi:hypothetical protein ACFL6R_03325 [Gemmatimonadota bacterium]